MTTVLSQVHPLSVPIPNFSLFRALPEDRSLLDILKWLPAEDILRTCTQLNKRFWRVIQDDSLWKMLFQRDFPGAKRDTSYPIKDLYRRGWLFPRNVRDRVYTHRILVSSLNIDWTHISEDSKTAVGLSQNATTLDRQIVVFDIESNKAFNLNSREPLSASFQEQNNGIEISVYAKNERKYILDIKKKTLVFKGPPDGNLYCLRNKVLLSQRESIKVFELPTGDLIASAGVDQSYDQFPCREIVRETVHGSIIRLSRGGKMEIWDVRPPQLHLRDTMLGIRFFLETEEGDVVCASSEALTVLSGDQTRTFEIPQLAFCTGMREFEKGKVVIAIHRLKASSLHVIDIHLQQVKELFVENLRFNPDPLLDPFFKRECLIKRWDLLQFADIKEMPKSSSLEIGGWDWEKVIINIRKGIGFYGPAQVVGITSKGVALWDFGVSVETCLSHMIQRWSRGDVAEKMSCNHQLTQLPESIRTSIFACAAKIKGLQTVHQYDWHKFSDEEKATAVTRYLKEKNFDPASVAPLPPPLKKKNFKPDSVYLPPPTQFEELELRELLPTSSHAV